MTLLEAVRLSKAYQRPFKRAGWHYYLYFEEQLGYYTDGYNSMDCSAITIDDAIADDYVLI